MCLCRIQANSKLISSCITWKTSCAKAILSISPTITCQEKIKTRDKISRKWDFWKFEESNVSGIKSEIWFPTPKLVETIILKEKEHKSYVKHVARDICVSNFDLFCPLPAWPNVVWLQKVVSNTPFKSFNRKSKKIATFSLNIYIWITRFTRTIRITRLTKSTRLVKMQNSHSVFFLDNDSNMSLLLL